VNRQRELTFDKDILLADLRHRSISGELEAVEAGQLGDLPLLLGRRHVEGIRVYDLSLLVSKKAGSKKLGLMNKQVIPRRRNAVWYRKYQVR